MIITFNEEEYKPAISDTDLDEFINQDTVPASVVRELAEENDRLVAENRMLLESVGPEQIEHIMIKKNIMFDSSFYPTTKSWCVSILVATLWIHSYDKDKRTAMLTALRQAGIIGQQV